MENNSIKFSIVVPTYNHGHFIKRCIDSVLAQTCSDWEMIIINNNSTDDTVEVVSSYQDPRISLINFANNGVIGTSRNMGIKRAQGEWVCFLDSDDWWYANKLAECSKYLDNSDIIYHDLDIYNNDQKPPIGRSRTRQVQGNIFKDLLINNNALQNSSVVVRKSILEQVGGISEKPDLVSVEDWDCWLRISQISKRFTYISLVLGAYWLGQNLSRAVKHADRIESLVSAHINSLSLSKEKIFLKKSLRYSQARIYQMNGYYAKALWLYCQSSPTILIKKLIKFFVGSIKSRLFGHYE